MSRLEQLQQKLTSAGLDALLITQEENRFYLSGFSGSTGHLLVTRERAALVLDGRYWAQFARECSGIELIKFHLEEHGSLVRASAAWLAGQGLRQVGVEGRNLVVADWQALQRDFDAISWQATENLVEELRQRKDAEELKQIGKAAQIADRAFRNALECLKVGVSERDFCLELEYQMQKLGARKPAFNSIVASGANGSLPHAGVTDRLIQAHELITVDFGAYRGLYNSDITRTVWLGQLDERQAFIYASVREAQRRAVDAVRPGVRCRELDSIAREHLRSCALAEYFTHGLGHGVGLAVHELPGVRSTSETVLEPGMVVTVEPGVYIPGETGCRIEDLVLVTESGYEKLTRSPYQELAQTHPLEAVGA